MAKPTLTAKFASDPGAPTAPPPSSHELMGWLMGEPPDSLWQNFLRQLDWQWQEYLKAGLFEGVFGWSSAITDLVAGAGSASLPNYNPTGLANAQVVRMAFDGAGGTAISGTLSGLSGGVAGRILTLMVLGASGTQLIVTHDDPNSSAANRILIPSNPLSVTVPRNGTITLWYDGDSSRWRIIGGKYA